MWILLRPLRQHLMITTSVTNDIALIAIFLSSSSPRFPAMMLKAAYLNASSWPPRIVWSRCIGDCWVCWIWARCSNISQLRHWLALMYATVVNKHICACRFQLHFFQEVRKVILLYTALPGKKIDHTAFIWNSCHHCCARLRCPHGLVVTVIVNWALCQLLVSL